MTFEQWLLQYYGGEVAIEVEDSGTLYNMREAWNAATEEAARVIEPTPATASPDAIRANLSPVETPYLKPDSAD